MTGVWGVVYAAGYGRRFGGYKQFETIRGERLVDRCIRVLYEAGCVHVVAVLPPDHLDPIGGVTVVAGGDTNPESVRNGVAAIPDSVELAVLHSPSHPLVSAELVVAVIGALSDGYDGAAPALPIHDVLKRTHGDGTVAATVDKTGVLITQMPMAFTLPLLHRALATSTDATDAQSLVERAGGRVKLIDGDPRNIHVTTRTELDLARRLA